MAFAAIQGLHQLVQEIVQEKDATIAGLEERLASVESRMGIAFTEDPSPWSRQLVTWALMSAVLLVGLLLLVRLRAYIPLRWNRN